MQMRKNSHAAAKFDVYSPGGSSGVTRIPMAVRCNCSRAACFRMVGPPPARTHRIGQPAGAAVLNAPDPAASTANTKHFDKSVNRLPLKFHGGSFLVAILVTSSPTRRSKCHEDVVARNVTRKSGVSDEDAARKLLPRNSGCTGESPWTECPSSNHGDNEDDEPSMDGAAGHPLTSTSCRLRKC